MDRTIPSFRIVLAMEKDDWKPFCNALDKKDRKKFDEMMLILLDFTSLSLLSIQYLCQFYCMTTTS
jgi:hypothetical protein